MIQLPPWEAADVYVACPDAPVLTTIVDADGQDLAIPEEYTLVGVAPDGPYALGPTLSVLAVDLHSGVDLPRHSYRRVLAVASQLVDPEDPTSALYRAWWLPRAEWLGNQFAAHRDEQLLTTFRTFIAGPAVYRIRERTTP